MNRLIVRAHQKWQKNLRRKSFIIESRRKEEKGSNKLLAYLKLTLLPQLIQLILLLLITTNFCYYGKLYLNTPLKMEINEYYEVPFCQGQKQMELEKEALLAYLPHEESSNNHFGVFPS